jgi:hypothetical protein
MHLNRHQQTRQRVKRSWLLLLATGFLLCVLAQNTRPVLAAGAIVPLPVSYTSSDAISSPSGATARTKKIRMACYPVWGQCTKDSDCCTGFCRVGRVTAYCDHK